MTSHISFPKLNYTQPHPIYLYIYKEKEKKIEGAKGEKDNQITWSETKNSQALETRHLIHEDTAATKTYTAEMVLMQTMYLNLRQYFR